MDERAVLIAGGGIGGLALALGLTRLGVPVHVLERAPEIHEVGAGIGVMPNAVRVLDRLGVGDAVRGIGTPLTVLEGCTWQGRTLTRLGIGDILPGAEQPIFVVHRADLQGILLRALPTGVVRTGAEVAGFAAAADAVEAHLAGGEAVAGALLVGADGLGSAVRRVLHGPEPLRYSGQTCYRGIARYRPDDPEVIREVQGPGQRASVIPIDGERAYWWAALNAPRGEADDPDTRRDRLLRLYAGWPYGIPGAIERTTGPVLRNDLLDRRPLSRWGEGRATLLGDAAHPMLPNLGQGGCTALEDALVLARCIAAHGPIAAALREYEAARIPRTTRLVRHSSAFGVAARWRRPGAVRLREMLVRTVPDRVAVAAFRSQVGFDAGALAPPRTAAGVR
jgi:2-polyprenyl-6-methoxyphenol hydroxylase-like FAD-dependent oxidoreductase